MNGREAQSWRNTWAALIAVVVAAVAAFGFAAANSVPESGAGDGSGRISGYTVSNVTYTLEAADPRYIDFWSMDVVPTAGAEPATSVYARVQSTGPLVACTNTPPSTRWICNPAAGSARVADADELRVVSVE